MGRSPEIAPLDGPAPIPSPHVLADRESSATACAAAVEPPSVRVVPPSVSSVLQRQAPAHAQADRRLGLGGRRRGPCDHRRQQRYHPPRHGTKAMTRGDGGIRWVKKRRGAACCAPTSLLELCCRYGRCGLAGWPCL